MPEGSLIIIGCGIKLISHITVEAKTYIKKSDCLLYLVNDPLVEQWLHKINPNAQSLNKYYIDHKPRKNSYQGMTNHIINELRNKKNVTVVVYGHPFYFADPALKAAIEAESLNIKTLVIPGISAEDCLFADLKINPGSHGLLSYEATDFLIRKRRIDPSVHLIVLQVGVIGILTSQKESIENIDRINIFKSYLLKEYPENHLVFLYEAAKYPHFQPRIEKIKLNDLEHAKLTPITTLYIPPIYKAEINDDMLHQLSLDKGDITIN